MRLVGPAAALAIAMLSLPAAAQEAGAQPASGGVFGWLMDAVSDLQSADQAIDKNKQTPEQSANEKTGAEPKPMEIPEDSPADQDSYKPDAGDAPK